MAAKKKTTRRKRSARKELAEYEGAKLVKSEAEALQSIADKIGLSLDRVKGKRIVDMEDYWYLYDNEFWARNYHVLYLSLSRKSSFRYFSRTIPPFIDDLKKFTRLKDLILCYFILGKDFSELPELPSLKRLELYGCGVEEGASVPPNLFVNLKNLKGLSIKEPLFSECPSSLKELKELRVLFIAKTKTDFSLSSEPLILPNLRKITFYECNFPSFPECLCFSENIEQITIDKHQNYLSLPTAFGNLKNLKVLKINAVITNVPETFGDLESLECLIIKRSISKLPSSIGNLRNLKHLEIHSHRFGSLSEIIGPLVKFLEGLLNELSGSNKSFEVKKRKGVTIEALESLPESIGELKNLKVLKIVSALKEIPASIGNLQSLEKMEIMESLVEGLPESISGLTSLKYMAIGSSIKKLPKLPENLIELKIIGKSLEISSEIFPPGLKSLSFCDRSGVQIPDCFSSLTSLEQLVFEKTKNKGELPPSLGDLCSLRTLVFKECPDLIVSEVIGRLEKLETLKILEVKSVRFPENPEGLDRLKYLKIDDTPLETFPRGICALKNLRTLIINGAELKEIPECIGNLSNLELLNLFDNPIRGIPESFMDLPKNCTVILERKHLDSVSRKIIRKMKEKGIEIRSRP